jgi:hypothetical protein
MTEFVAGFIDAVLCIYRNRRFQQKEQRTTRREYEIYD